MTAAKHAYITYIQTCMYALQKYLFTQTHQRMKDRNQRAYRSNIRTSALKQRNWLTAPAAFKDQLKGCCFL